MAQLACLPLLFCNRIVLLTTLVCWFFGYACPPLSLFRPPWLLFGISFISVSVTIFHPSQVQPPKTVVVVQDRVRVHLKLPTNASPQRWRDAFGFYVTTYSLCSVIHEAFPLYGWPVKPLSTSQQRLKTQDRFIWTDWRMKWKRHKSTKRRSDQMRLLGTHHVCEIFEAGRRRERLKRKTIIIVLWLIHLRRRLFCLVTLLGRRWKRNAARHNVLWWTSIRSKLGPCQLAGPLRRVANKYFLFTTYFSYIAGWPSEESPAPNYILCDFEVLRNQMKI